MRTAVERAYARGYNAVRFASKVTYLKSDKLAEANEKAGQAARVSGAAAPAPGAQGGGGDPAAEVAKSGGRSVLDLLRARKARNEDRAAAGKKVDKNERRALGVARTKDRKRKAAKEKGDGSSSSKTSTSKPSSSPAAPEAGKQGVPARAGSGGKQKPPSPPPRREAPSGERTKAQRKTDDSANRGGGDRVSPAESAGREKAKASRERVTTPETPSVSNPSARSEVKPGTKQKDEAAAKRPPGKLRWRTVDGQRVLESATPVTSQPRPCAKVSKTGKKCLKRMSSEQANIDKISLERRQGGLHIRGRREPPPDNTVIRADVKRAKGDRQNRELSKIRDRLAARVARGTISLDKLRDIFRVSARDRGVKLPNPHPQQAVGRQ